MRVVELFDVGSNTNWDSHSNIDDHRALSRNVDRPIAALIADLKQRGLLDETLIVGCSEFGNAVSRGSEPFQALNAPPWAGGSGSRSAR